MNGQGLAGKICVVTGANAGIGFALCSQLGAQGATVVMVCRNAERGAAARAALQAEGGRGRFHLVLADLAERAQVRRAAAEIEATFPTVDVLVNNAGLYLPRRRLTSEGLETMFAVNHLAPFLLTRLLGDALQAAPQPRVVTLSSFGHVLGHVDFDDLQAERRFNGLRQYSTTKLQNILFTRELARRSAGTALVAHAFNPGAVASEFAQDERGLFSIGVLLVRPFQKSPQKAARQAAFLCASEEAARSSGDYWSGARRRKPSREARNDEVALRLWEFTSRLADA
jgi:NAD(P)-dependent dehydrogenase (short-subunit alcohol dehydrogenase family)